MGALLGGGEALPIDNMGAMSGSVPEAGTASALGALSANGGMAEGGGAMDAMSPAAGQIQGLLQSLNPVQQVGLQGLLGAISPIRGGQAATPTGQPLPVAAAAPSTLPQATPPSTPAMGGDYPGGGTTLGGSGSAAGGAGVGPNAGRIMRQMEQSSRSQEPQPKPATTSTQTPPVSLPTPMAYDWSGYRAQARDSVQGMQQMPYVFSGYNQINGQNVSDIMKMFYPGWNPTAAEAKPEEARPGAGSPIDYSGAIPQWGY